ncbi:MAG: tetratricopeptide repeat protein [Bacillota bacterium]|nr:tetratricopeptide repeat protein [Bacillota bacterium]
MPHSGFTGWRKGPVYAVPGSTQPSSPPREATLAQGIEFHDLAVKGDKGATKKAYELLKAAHLANPEDPVAQAYFGSATALMGRDAIDQNERFSLGMRGLKILDQAVRAAPDNVTVRTLRAYVCYRLPEMYFHRTSTAVEDFRHLVDLYEKNKDLFAEGFYWQILFDLGKAYHTVGRTAEARETWKKLLSVAREPKYRELLKAEGVMERPFDPPAASGGRLKWPQSVMKTKEGVDAAELSEGIRLHDLALAGDAGAAEKAFELLDRICRKQPDNALAEAYRASALSLVGKYSSDTGLMFENAIKAMITLDQLVARHPDHLGLRLLRGNHSYRLPEPFFRRSTTAITDFEYLLSLLEKQPNALPAATVQRILYDLGVCYDRLGMAAEAKAAWTRLLSQQPDPTLRRLAQEKLGGCSAGRWARPVSWTETQLFDEAMRLLRLGAEGNRRAAEQAHQLVSQAYELSPQDALLQACYGSSVALLGKYSSNPSEMFSKAVEGLLLLKKAVGKDWADPRIRLLRGYLCYSLPDTFFHLTSQAIKDFRFVKTAYEQGDGRVPEAAYWQVLYDLGRALKRAGETEEARKVWKRLLAVSSDPQFQTLVSAEEVN